VVDDWNEHEQQEPGDEPAEQSWSVEHPLGDPEAWRGGAADEDADAWRGTEPPSEWPEWDAGPEYQMWKRKADGEL